MNACKIATKSIITGAGGALAEAVVRSFQEDGWRLGLSARGEQNAARLRQTHPERRGRVHGLSVYPPP